MGPLARAPTPRLVNVNYITGQVSQYLPSVKVEPVAFLIEDSVEIRASLIPAMEELASTKVFAFAETEKDALDWLRVHPLDWQIMVVDLFLKEGSGLGILTLSGPHQPHQRMVVLTNYATQDMRERCMKLGADAVFDKSNELDDFFDYCLDEFKAGPSK